MRAGARDVQDVNRYAGSIAVLRSAARPDINSDFHGLKEAQR